MDLPGTYSLTAGSPEEEVARDYLLSGAADVTLAVADATCLCRNLNLILQIRQITSRLVVCVNLLDEAETVCNRIILINRGRIVADGTAGEIIKKAGAKNLEEAFCQLTTTEDEA